MKKVLFAISVFSIMNVVGLGFVGALAWQKGWLEKDRVREAVSILRGHAAEKHPTSEIAGPSGEVVKAKEEVGSIEQTGEMIAKGRDAEEMARIEFARREREIQDGLRLWEARQLALLREKEALDEEKRRFAAEREAIAKSAGDGGGQKELDTLSGIPAKAAKELLMAKNDAEAVRLLKSMEQRKLNKIVKECKTEEERQWIGRILNQFEEAGMAKAEDLDAG